MRDDYLESLYLTLEMCNLIIQNSLIFNSAVMKKAEEIRRETEERIRTRKLVTKYSFCPGCRCRCKKCDDCDDYKDCPGTTLD